MTLGANGESCYDAIAGIVKNGARLRYSEIVRKVRNAGTWRDATIRRHLMSMVTNLPPARDEWKNTVPILFLNPDGTYERFDPNRHPTPQE
jgi:hypothetical protein